MSYCVNCGVELDSALKKCPLCDTLVYHPGKNQDNIQEPKFPKKRGEVEKVSKKEMVIFISVLLLAVSITCALLNLLVYDSNWWSIPVNGVCITLWVFIITALFYEKLTIFGVVFFDAVSVGNYLFLISLITVNDEWLNYIGLPILGAVFLVLEIALILSKIFPSSFLTSLLYFFVSVATICTTVEVVIDNYVTGEIKLTWSAIVLTVCVIIIVLIILIMMMGRLRNNIRRRLHF